MKTFRHVRFRLTELIKAVHREMEVKLAEGEAAEVPSAPQAFEWYWQWCWGNGWKLEGVTMARDRGCAVAYFEQNAQLNIRCEEFWNVVWSGDEPTCDPDIVHGEGIEELE